MTLPDPPSSWNALTKEQLIYIHSLPRSEMDDTVYKLKVFLNLCGLELCQQSFYQEPDIRESEGATDEEKLKNIQAQLDWAESVIDGTAKMTVVLRPVGKDDEAYSISDEDLFDAVNHFTKFLDDPFKLMAQPLGDIVIGKHTYKTPDPLFANLTYEQYQNAQSALQRFWTGGQNIEILQKQIKEDEEKHHTQQMKLVKFSKGKYKPKEYEPDVKLMKQIDDNLKMIRDSQGEFLVHVLTCLQPQVFDEAVLDKDGKPSYSKTGKARIRKILHLTEPSIDVDAFSRRCQEEITSEAPAWLFPILYQHFQSSLLEHKHNFPKLFSGGGGGGSDNPFVATVSTLNVLMHEQGYNDQRATLDANVVFNFQKLDELTRRAEEMEKMNKEMKRKSRKK